MSNLIYQGAEDSRAAGIAYHLIPEPVWEVFKRKEWYQPEAYGNDGFIHLTLGTEPLLAVANLFYTGDARNFKVLVLDTTRVQSPIRYDDPDETYPHIYGLLNTDSVIGELAISRDGEGRFTGIEAT